MLGFHERADGRGAILRGEQAMRRIRFGTIAGAVLVSSIWTWVAGQAPELQPGGQKAAAGGAAQVGRQGGRGGRGGGAARVRARKVVLAWADTRNGIAQ